MPFHKPKIRTALFVCLITPALGGCWFSNSDFYSNETPLTPFSAGPIRTVNLDDQTASHSVLSVSQGTYRIGSVGYFRLYPLPGASSDYMILDVTRVLCLQASCPPSVQHYYGLAHRTSSGVEELMHGDCTTAEAENLGAEPPGALGNCEFKNRNALEKALLTLIGTKATSITYEE